MSKGVLAVVSGFSGSGKGTLMKRLLKKYDNYGLSISATTRQPREGETHGKDYFFLTTDAFEAMISRGELIEYAKYLENYYGTPRAYVEEQRNLGKDVILEIEIQGAMKIKEQYPDAVFLFVTPPSAKELKRRLVERGTETAQVIASRLSRAVQESEGMESYDYLIVNDNLETCVDKVHAIIQSEHERTSRNQAFIEKIKEELKVFVEGE